MKARTTEDLFRYQWIGWIITVLLVVGAAFAGVQLPPLPPMPGMEPGPAAAGDYTHLRGLNVAVPTTVATATPGVYIQSSAAGAALQVDVAGTPAIVVDGSGNTTISGTCSGCSINSASGLRITQPTAAATATPGLAINSLAAGSKLLEIADAATPVFSVLNGGAVSRTGNDTMTGDLNVTGAGRVAAATAVATATPAFVVDSLGAGNVLLEIRDAATPVASFNNGGGLDLQVGTFTMANDEVLSNATDGVVTVNGQWGYKQYMIAKTASYTVTAAESGALFTNAAAEAAITFTLPAPAAGLIYGFTEHAAQVIYITPSDTEQILSETNAADDDIVSTAQYDVIWLVSDGTNWLPINVIGTWTDCDG
jgi:hypothetical protein